MYLYQVAFKGILVILVVSGDPRLSHKYGMRKRV